MKRFIVLALVLLVGVLPVAAQEEDIQAALDAIVAEYADADDAALVLQVTTPDGTWTAAGGMADEDTPTAPQDRFRIGSMSKTFVAAAALLLVEDGVLGLDDLASEWLPDDIVDNIANVDRVTVRQLLSMRSGIDDYLGTDEFWDAVADDPTYAWTAAEALEYAYDLSPLFAPNAEFNYSNSNYLLMQLILEEASGVPLHTLVRERILDPLGLDDTYTQISETLPGAFVNAYEDFDGDGEAEDVTDINDGAGLGDGALVSNVDDLTAFYRALLQEQSLLNAESMRELLSFQLDSEVGGYSLGLNEWETPLGAAWGHSGGVVGFLSIGAYLPEQEMIVMVLAASWDVSPEDVALAALEVVGE